MCSPTGTPTRSPHITYTPDPTPMPTTSPTMEPSTKRPTTTPKPTCTCDNLGYEFELRDEHCMDWNNNTMECTPGCDDYCDYKIHCYKYAVIVKTPDIDKTDCDSLDEYTETMMPHKPEYVVFPHSNDCAVNMDYAQYWSRVYEVREDPDGDCTVKDDPDDYAYYDDEPDSRTEAKGIRINPQWGRDGEYEFEICLVGEADTMSVNQMNVGWGFSVEYGGLDSNWDYGYVCDNNIELPDLCSVTSSSLSANLRPGAPANGVEHTLKHREGFGEEEMLRYRFTIWDLVHAQKQFIFIAVLTVLGVGLFVVSFAQCIEWKQGKRKLPYGQVIKFVESDTDDGTDSEDELVDDQ